MLQIEEQTGAWGDLRCVRFCNATVTVWLKVNQRKTENLETVNKDICKKELCYPQGTVC